MEYFKAIEIYDLTTEILKDMKQSAGGIYSKYLHSLTRFKRSLYLEEFQKMIPICIDRNEVRDLLDSTFNKIACLESLLKNDTNLDIAAKIHSCVFQTDFYLLTRKQRRNNIETYNLKIWISRKEINDFVDLGLLSQHLALNAFLFFEFYDNLEDE